MIHIVDHISSTNDWLAKYYSEVDDTIIAIKQSKGKGRRGNAWKSQIGGFYLSTVSSNHKLLPFIVGISIMNVLEKDCKGLNLKWPNDIILQGKKLGGILCEDFGDFSIIGIGINFENEPDIDNSTNLISNNISIDKSFFLSSFLYNFDMKSSLTSEEIIENFIEYDCLIDKEVFWEGSSGIVKSIALDGSLVVESNDKELNLYSEEVHLERY